MASANDTGLRLETIETDEPAFAAAADDQEDAGILVGEARATSAARYRLPDVASMRLIGSQRAAA